MLQYDVVILGGGAAGLMCAAQAALRGCRVIVLEHNDRPGKKIRISGGGRCNFTNRSVAHHNFIGRNPNFTRSALARYRPQDFVELVDSYGIAWHEKTLGQLFCDGSAQQIIDMLVSECNRGGVTIVYRARISSWTHTDSYEVRYETDEGNNAIVARSLVVATGGLSIPSLGATDIGYRIAESFQHPMVSPLPALVPVTFSASEWHRYGSLSGISCEAVVTAAQGRFRENVLFTHRGLSGPAILQISSYLRDTPEFTIDLLPDQSVDGIIDDYPSERRYLRSVLSEFLPQRLLDVWPSPALDRAVNAVKRTQILSTIQALKSWKLHPTGTEGYAKAEVTSGGVCTTRLSSKTMESTIVDGLFFIGEVVDVTGWLGGYNFQWAWSSAVAAAEAISQRREA